MMDKFVDEKWFEMLPVLNVPSTTISKISMQLQFMAQKVQWFALGKIGEYLRNAGGFINSINTNSGVLIEASN